MSIHTKIQIVHILYGSERQTNIKGSKEWKNWNKIIGKNYWKCSKLHEWKTMENPLRKIARPLFVTTNKAYTLLFFLLISVHTLIMNE